MSFSFFVDSDIQINHSSQIRNKEGHIKKMLELVAQAHITETPVKAFLSPGDLTNLGRYYSPPLVFLNKLLKAVNRKIPRIKPLYSAENELQVVLDKYVHPLQKVGVKSYLCAGNHDTYGPFYKPVLNYLRRRHGNWHRLNYSFDITGLHFACCGVAPNKDSTRDWLSCDLARLPRNTPVVLMWHYPVSGPYSGAPYPGGEWWSKSQSDSDREKDRTYNLIKNYNVIGIFTGHFHSSYRSDWHGIPIFNTGGPSFCHAIYDPSNTGSLKIEYYDKDGETDVPYHSYKDSNEAPFTMDGSFIHVDLHQGEPLLGS